MTILTAAIAFFKPSLIKIFLLFFISLSLRFTLQLTGQSWIKTTSHTSTLTILPVVTYVITSVISGNVALSLGMVGALSIVRFRNPVRSPLELTVYFAAITMGITASVSLKWLIVFIFAIYLSIFLLIICSLLSKIVFKKQFFVTSFSEGNSLSTLEINAKQNIDMLDSSKFLRSKSSFKDGDKQYLLVSNDFMDLRKILTELEYYDEIINYQLNEC